jgi:copper homeostasis protein
MKMPPTPPTLEIAVHSFKSAKAADQNGANRIELCSALQTGGLTPDVGLLDQVIHAVSLPVHVLIRPRLGNFVYDHDELSTIIRTIELCKEKKVHGVVVGCLTKDHLIDKMQLKEIVAHCEGVDLTFHRAIDVCQNVMDALDFLIDLGFDRVLTSGGAVSAEKGLANIRQMIEYTHDRAISIMPGAGISKENIKQIMLETGCKEIHASAKTEYYLPNWDPIGLTSIAGTSVEVKWESDPVKIKEMSTILSQL